MEQKEAREGRVRAKMHFTTELVSDFLGTIMEKAQDQVSTTNYKH